MGKSAKKYLIVKGCAGIGNRIFSLVSAIEYAKKTNRTIVVDWKDGVFSNRDSNAFNVFFDLKDIDCCDFDEFMSSAENHECYPKSFNGNLDKGLYDLFMLGSSKYLKKLPGVSKLKGRLSRLSEFWLYSFDDNFGKSAISDWLAIRSLFSNKNMEFGHKLSAKRMEEVVVFSDYWPGIIDKKLFKHIGIKPVLTDMVELKRVQLGIGENTVGLHVRFSDKKPTRELDRLIQYLKSQEIKELFLCTDSEYVETIFKQEMKTKLIIFPKFFPKKMEAENMHHWGMKNNDYSKSVLIYQESLVDLLLLASCKKIFYQGNSSYSKLALEFNGHQSEAFDWLKFEN